MTKKDTTEFYSIVNDILINDKFKELDSELHHGISRYGHSLRVAKGAYKMSKKMGLDYHKTARAALLHDFYKSDELNAKNSFVALKIHPHKALENAMKYFDISLKEQNIIESHMFPLGGMKPKYREAWIVTYIDKKVALYEMLRFKLSLKLSIFLLFIFNFITMKNF